MEKTDVVIPTRGEPSLQSCLRAVTKNVLFNRIILIAPTKFFKDLLKDFRGLTLALPDEKNIGKIRALGLGYVTTPFYGSIDSDVLVTKRTHNRG